LPRQLIDLDHRLIDLAAVVLGRLGHAGGGLLEGVGQVGGAVDHVLASVRTGGCLPPSRKAGKQVVERVGDSGIAGDVEQGLKRRETRDVLLRLPQQGILLADSLFGVLVSRADHLRRTHSTGRAAGRVERHGRQELSLIRITGRLGVGDVILRDVERLGEGVERAGCRDERGEDIGHRSLSLAVEPSSARHRCGLAAGRVPAAHRSQDPFPTPIEIRRAFEQPAGMPQLRPQLADFGREMGVRLTRPYPAPAVVEAGNRPLEGA
jgi:hypothetical protein